MSDLRAAHRRRREEFEAAYLAALEELLEVVLPSLAPDAVERAASVTGVEGLQTTAEAEAERKACRKELEAIESDPLFLNRERLLCPETGEIGSALAQLKTHREALEPVLRICFEHPRFLKLLESGYGTPAYRTPFWRMTYHLDRKAAQEISDRCKGKSWEKIRQEVVSAMEASSVLDERIKALGERAHRIEAMVRRRSQLISRLKRLDQIWLATGRWRIRRALEADPDSMFERLGAVPEWREALVRWRTRRELVEEYQRLKTEYLVPGLESGDEELLSRYQQLEARLSRFDARPEDEDSMRISPRENG